MWSDRMTSFRRIGFAVALLFLAACNQKAATAPAVDHKQSAAPASTRDWSQAVSATPEGGYLMGNPAAKVKVIEFGSLTCPHCGAFARESAPLLIAQYVKPGLVSYEFRNFARDPLDLAASLLVRCAGPAPFFKLIDQIYADQDNWLGKVEHMSPADTTRINALPPTQGILELVKIAGLDRFVAMRGVPSARAHQCLTDQKGQERIAAIRAAAIDKFSVDGTPTFIINGEKAEGVYDFATMEPRLQQALGS
jgi:protein-disulfide isomerase